MLVKLCDIFPPQSSCSQRRPDAACGWVWWFWWRGGGGGGGFLWRWGKGGGPPEGGGAYTQQKKLVGGGLSGGNRKDEGPPQWEMAYTQSNNAVVVVGWLGGSSIRLVEDINVNTVWTVEKLAQKCSPSLSIWTAFRVITPMWQLLSTAPVIMAIQNLCNLFISL